jgi:hypothetical protein
MFAVWARHCNQRLSLVYNKRCSPTRETALRLAHYPAPILWRFRHTPHSIGETPEILGYRVGGACGKNFRMVDTCAVFKLPVRCGTCSSEQYETLLRISQAKPVVCVECRQSIDLPRDNSAIFGRAVAFVEGQRE